MKNIIIHFDCPDQKGIVSKITNILYESRSNILSLEQFVDQDIKKFYMRENIEVENFTDMGP